MQLAEGCLKGSLNQYYEAQDAISFYMMEGVEGEGLVPWVGRFYLRETFQSQTHTEKILYYDSR